MKCLNILLRSKVPYSVLLERSYHLFSINNFLFRVNAKLGCLFCVISSLLRANKRFESLLCTSAFLLRVSGRLRSLLRVFLSLVRAIVFYFVHVMARLFTGSMVDTQRSGLVLCILFLSYHSRVYVI